MHLIDQCGHRVGGGQLVNAVAEIEDVTVIAALLALRRPKGIEHPAHLGPHCGFAAEQQKGRT